MDSLCNAGLKTLDANQNRTFSSQLTPLEFTTSQITSIWHMSEICKLRPHNFDLLQTVILDFINGFFSLTIFHLVIWATCVIPKKEIFFFLSSFNVCMYLTASLQHSALNKPCLGLI